MTIYPAFFLALIVSLLMVPVVRVLCFKLGKVSKPRSDRWNRLPTPSMGGIGMFVGFAAAVVAVGFWSGEEAHLHWSMLAGIALMFGLGLYDDLHELTPPAKLVGQILAASFVIFFGRVISFFPWGFANVILTFVWLVGISNAINLLDNMDGLAAGISLIAAGFLSYFFWKTGNAPLLLVSLSLAGSILGFLIFNFPPAKIFMGDSGSMLLGFTLASLAVAYTPRASDVFSVMGVPILLFLLPILDTSLVTITRIMRGQSPAQGGTDHTSHRLIAFGLSERQAVLILYAVGIVSGIVGAVLEALDYDLSLVLVPILLISLSLMVAYLGRIKMVSSVTPTQGNITRLMVNLTYKRRLLEISLDFLLIGVAYYLARWIYAGLSLDALGLSLFLRSLPVALAGAYISFFAFGVYRGVWRYVGLDELIIYAGASLVGVIITGTVLITRFSTAEYPPVLFFLFGIFLFLGLAMSRVSFRILDRLSGISREQSEWKTVLIYGAEDAGEIALRWIVNNPSLGYRVIGFIDDDPMKWGRRIHGIDVLGGAEKARNILEERSPDGVIVTSADLLSKTCGARLVESCRKKGIWVRLLRLDFEAVE